MNLLTRLYDRFTNKRSILGADTWLPTPSLAGVVVDSQTVTTLACYYAGIYVLASDIAAIPFNVVKRSSNGVREIDYAHPYHDLLSHEPDDECDAVGFFQSIVWHLLTRGNSYVHIERDARLRPAKLHLLDPTQVQPTRTNKTEKLFYVVAGERYLAEDIVHIANIGADPVVGVNPIAHCRETLGLSIGVEKFGASYFGNGVHAKGIFTTDQAYNATADKEFRKNVNEQHQGPYSANKPLLLWSGVSYQSTAIPPEDAQFLATRAFQVEEVCRILNMAPSKLQAWDKANFASLEEANSNHYGSTLLPWIRRIESQFSRKLFTREERKVWSIVHDTSASQRGRILDQANADKILWSMGAICPDEIRAKRGQGPIEGGSTYLVPLNSAPLDKVASASLETLKGLDKPATPPDAPSDEIDVPVAVVDGDTVNAARNVVLDTARRMVTREVNALRKVAKRGDLQAIMDGLDAHYSNETDTLAEAYSPALAVYSAVSKRSIDPKVFAKSIVSRSSEEILACVEGPNSTEALNRLLDRWKTHKPDDIVSTLG